MNFDHILVCKSIKNTPAGKSVACFRIRTGKMEQWKDGLRLVEATPCGAYASERILGPFVFHLVEK